MAVIDIHTINLTVDGQAVEVHYGSEPFPDQVPEPPFVIGKEHNGRIARINADPVPRLPGKITNAIERLAPLKKDGSGVDPRSKVTLKFNDEWKQELFRLNGPWVGARLLQLAIGWFDTGYPTFNLLLTSGNLVVAPPYTDAFRFNGWMEIDVQAFGGGTLGFDYDYFPFLVFKQTEVKAEKGTGETFILADRNAGDTYLPVVSDQPAFVSTIYRDTNQNGITFFPTLPCETYMKDMQVLVTEWGFKGSNTYARIDSNWYPADIMHVTGEGNQTDRETFIRALEVMPCAPPVIGWTRQE